MFLASPHLESRLKNFSVPFGFISPHIFLHLKTTTFANFQIDIIFTL